MPKFNIEGKEVDVRFNHFTDIDKLTGKETRGTSCTIWLGSVLLGAGEAVLYYKDNFNKRVGRKESFTKAVLDSGFNKEGRAKLWEAFFKIEKKG